MSKSEPAQTTPRARTDRGGVRLREGVQTLPAYVAGASGSGAHVFKLSSNELPYPPLPAVSAAIADAAEDINRYPAIYADRVSEAIAASHGQHPDRVLAGNGSVSVAELIARSMCEPGDEVVYAWRSFEAYPIIVQTAGGVSVQVPLTADGAHDLDAMAAAITDATRLVIVCTPNNPTGNAITHTALVAFLDKVPSDVMVLLDEAYVHFDRTPDKIDAMALLPVYKNLVVLRTFSKAYGLAGLRFGYAVARRKLIISLRSASTPFGVNRLAQAAALAALNQQDAVDAMVTETVAERERVVAELRGQGWSVTDPQGNFYWLPIGDGATSFAARAHDAGVMVRPFAGHGVRVTIGEREANDIALDVAARWLREPPPRG